MLQGTYGGTRSWARGIALLVLLVIGAPMALAFASGPSAHAAAVRQEQLEPGDGFGRASGSQQVRALQSRLLQLGYRTGPVDGLFGPLTEAAVRAFQHDRGLSADGIVGASTAPVLKVAAIGILARGEGYASQSGSERVRQLQRQLRRLGYRPAGIDGRFGPRTQAALRNFQQRRGLPASGVVDARTRMLVATLTKQGADRDSTDALKRSRRNSRDGFATAGRRASSEMATASAGVESTGGFNWLAAVLAASGWAALVALAVFVRWRAKWSGWSVPVAPDLIATGYAPDIGEFRGHLQAIAVVAAIWGGRRRTQYLVSDVDKPRPFWVDQRDIGRVTVAPAAADETADDAPTRRKRDRAGAPWVRALGYASAQSAVRLDDPKLRLQRERLNRFCDERGWTLVEVVGDAEPTNGRTLERPTLEYALERLQRGDASTLVVTEVHRLCRSAAELGLILDRLDELGASLVCMEPMLDTGTEIGAAASRIISRITAWDRERHATRTRRGLAAARKKSRPAVEDRPELKQRIVAMRAEGMSLRAITDALNRAGVPTVRGGVEWRPSSVQAALGYKRPARAFSNGGEDVHSGGNGNA